MYTVKKQSKWKFGNSAVRSLGIDFAAAGNGTLSLKDPDDWDVDFPYEFVGGGVSWGPNLKDGIDSDIIGVGSPFDWASGGDIWISSSFEKDELNSDDFTGFCIVVEVSLGLPVASLSAMEMWFGIPASMAPKELSLLIIQSQTSVVMARMLSRRIKLLRTAAKGRLRVGSAPIGLSLSVGATLSLGSIGKGKYPQAPIIKMPSQPESPKTQTQKDKSAVITLSGDVLFDWDKSFIKPIAHGELANALNRINASTSRRIRIIGYTDSTEKTPGHNKKLSDARAISVSNYFRAALPGFRIETEGRGAAEPVADNKTEAGRAKNRRVEIYLMTD